MARLLLLVLFASCAACGGSGEKLVPPPSPPAPPAGWSWSDLGGPPAPKSAELSNHTPLAVVGDVLLLGTADGVWRRSLAGTSEWERAGLPDGFAVHALRRSTSGGRLVAVGWDAQGIGTGATAWYSTNEGASWVAASAWPSHPTTGESFAFYTLEPDPDDSAVWYGGLTADSVAVSVDSGATWILTDGATEPNFGDYCVHHRPREVDVLLQGCELPLDIAWIGAKDIQAANRFVLPGFRMLFGGTADVTELENRRINAIAAMPSGSERVLFGVEGGLLELTSASGEWRDRDDVTANWIFKVSLDSTEDSFPYTYVTAILPLEADGQALLFGGGVNGHNEVLSLYERSAGTDQAVRLDSPLDLHDPWVEQAWALGANDVLLVLTEGSTDPQDPRELKVVRLTR